MISFAKFWQAMLLINIAILLVNFANIFPEQYRANVGIIEDTYNELVSKLQALQKTNIIYTITYAGAMAYIGLTTVKLILFLFLLAPIYVGQTLSAIFESIGMPGELAYIFTLLTYLSFIFWIIDSIRGRSVND